MAGTKEEVYFLENAEMGDKKYNAGKSYVLRIDQAVRWYKRNKAIPLADHESKKKVADPEPEKVAPVVADKGSDKENAGSDKKGTDDAGTAPGGPAAGSVSGGSRGGSSSGRR